MHITVIGAGNMGSAFVKQLTRAGHYVSVTSRDQAKAEALASQHPGALALAPEGAAANADAVILATGYDEAVEALRGVNNLEGKVVIDITNPITTDFSGLGVGYDTSAAEEISNAVPGAKVVKAFNTVFAQVLEAGADFGNGNRATVFYAGDDDHAKQTAQTVAESLGFDAVDAGPLRHARYLEPLAFLNIYFGYGAGHGTSIAPTWIHRA